MKQHRFAPLAALIAAVTLGVGLILSTALSQEDMKEVKAEDFAPHTRPAALFAHDAHNEKAKIDDCAVCHHGKDADGKMTVEETSEGQPCADCHAVDARSGTPLMRAYHQKCIACHRQKNAGPVCCGECHKL